MQSFTQWARCDQQTSQFSDIRFTIHRLKFTLAANGKEFYGQVILFYLSRMLEKTKPMVNYLMNNLGFGFSVFTVVENQSKSLILQPYELKQNI